jgi:hypothetical protein
MITAKPSGIRCWRAFAETYFINGGCGRARGHTFGWKYQFTDTIQGGLYYFFADRARSVSTYGASNKATTSTSVFERNWSLRSKSSSIDLNSQSPAIRSGFFIAKRG